VADRTEHCHQYSVEAVRTFYVLGRQDVRQRPRNQQHCSVLPAAQTPVGADERFECSDIERDVPDAAVDVQVGRLWHHDRAPEHPGCVGAVRFQRVLPGHLAGVELDASVLAQDPRHTGGVQAGDETNTLMSTQTRHEAGPAFLEILQGEPDGGVCIEQAQVS
jgi:hypothetical protein